MKLVARSSKTKLKQLPVTLLLICSILTWAPGCRIPCLRGPEPAREIPDTFQGEISGENSSQVSIEEFFDDPTLTELIGQGMMFNQELKILGEEIQIANNEILRRRGAYLPFIGLGAGAGLDKPSFFMPNGAAEEQLTAANGSPFPTPLPDFLVAANLSWQIDIWRQLRNARDAATLRFLGTTEGRNYVVTRLVAEIAENYYGLMALDKRIENLDFTIRLQEQSLEIAKSQKEGVRGTELGVQRFRAEVRKNQSQKLIIRQEIIEVENRINFLVGRFPQPVHRVSDKFFDLSLHALKLGVPAELLQNRPDIRKAELELAAADLDIKVARANFYPRVRITAGIGYEAFNPKYLVMTPESLIYNVAGDLMVPLINRTAIQADYMNANAKQLQAVYNYQRTVLNAFTEVINRISKVQNYSSSIELKKQQLQSLEASVDVATKLFNATRVEYIDVLFAQRDLMDARMVLIDTKREQLGAIVNTYQALGGGLIQFSYPDPNLVPVDPNLPLPAGPADEVLNPVPPSPDNGGQAAKDGDKVDGDNKVENKGDNKADIKAENVDDKGDKEDKVEKADAPDKGDAQE